MSIRQVALVCGAMTFAAASARADFIREVSTGSFTVTSDDGTTRSIGYDLVVTSEIGGWGIVTISAETSQTLQAGSDPLTGTATFFGATPDDFITISLTGVADGETGQQSFSFSGLWETTSTGGDYAGLSGAGDFSGSGFYTSGTGGLVDVIFQGDLVPAPATAALLGAGGLVAFRRRRS